MTIQYEALQTIARIKDVHGRIDAITFLQRNGIRQIACGNKIKSLANANHDDRDWILTEILAITVAKVGLGLI